MDSVPQKIRMHLVQETATWAAPLKGEEALES